MLWKETKCTEWVISVLMCPENPASLSTRKIPSLSPEGFWFLAFFHCSRCPQFCKKEYHVLPLVESFSWKHELIGKWAHFISRGQATPAGKRGIKNTHYEYNKWYTRNTHKKEIGESDSPWNVNCVQIYSEKWTDVFEISGNYCTKPLLGA